PLISVNNRMSSAVTARERSARAPTAGAPRGQTGAPSLIPASRHAVQVPSARGPVGRRPEDRARPRVAQAAPPRAEGVATTALDALPPGVDGSAPLAIRGDGSMLNHVPAGP